MELANLDQGGRNLAKSKINSTSQISIQIDGELPVARRFNTDLTLKEVREQLSNSGEQARISEYMDFYNTCGIISRNDESTELLKGNLHDGYILKIKSNIIEATRRCMLNYGRKMTEDGPVKVDNMIFEFPQGITQSIKITKLDYTEYKYEGKCENKHENFLRKNLVAEGEISASVLSNLSIGLTISYGRHISATHHTKFSSEYEIILLPKYEIEIDVEKVQPSEDFIQAVNSALGSNNPKNELKKMSDNFGNYIASKVQIGGRINKIVHNNASSTLQQTSTDRSIGMEVCSDNIVSIGGNYSNKNGYNESSSTSNIKKKAYIRVYGGDKNKFKKDGMSSWQDSLSECINWEIIKYVDLISIFDVLNLELRQKVLEAMGHKVLYSSIDSVDNIVMSSSKFSYEHELSIPSELNLSLKECQIFASVMNKEKMENVFSTRIIVYTSNNSASVVLHWINKSSMWHRTKFFNLQIGWVVVGQPRDFKFNENCDIIDSGKYALTNNQISIYDQFKDHSILVACTQQLPQQIDFHPKNSTLVTGVHFSCLNDSQLSACFFIYDLKKKKLHKENLGGELTDLFVHCR
ncbi:11007_t:CDS:1 [Racocetra fulgida]|uniref:11007_t:CDS:1 n=1 Tax=Racocetra fulgida TaxID=60492 RepID=A0A9N9CD69_9GLOM|nr:11007_t:CDS:1 [Racocetra fulgida]